LLSGDAEALRRHYTVESEGDAQRWVLRLVPRDDRLAAKLRELRLHGRGDELRCIENAAVQGEVQRPLLGAAAEAARREGASGDLRRFLPDARTPEQRLLLDELGEGPGSRLLMLALSGDTPQALAERSHALREALADDARFVFVANGADAGLDAIPDALRPYRYLLSPRLDGGTLDADALAEALDARLQDLGSPAADLVEPLVPSDPTLETLALAEAWRPA